MKTETEKVILHQDVTLMNASIAAHKAIIPQLYSVLLECKALGIEPTNSILVDLWGNGEEIKKNLNQALEKDLASFRLPFMLEKARSEFNEILAKVDKIVRKVHRDILKIDVPFAQTFNTALFTYTSGGIVFDEVPIIEQFTIYLDSPEKQKVKDMAEALLITIAEFNEAVRVASNGKVKGLTQNSPEEYYKIVELFNDNSLSIDFTSFSGIN